MNKLFIKGLSLCVLLFTGQVFAAFEDPATASWGGWSRGDTGTLYANWDNFADDGRGVLASTLPFPIFQTDSTPDASHNTSVAEIGALNPLTITTVDGNWNTPAAVQFFSAVPVNPPMITPAAPGGAFAAVAAPTLPLAPGPVTAALQISTLGGPLFTPSVGLTDGVSFFVSPDSVIALGSNETLFLWNLAAGLSFYSFGFGLVGPDISLNAVSLDVGPAAVPLPAAVWLFGSALIGLIGIGRRKAAS